MLKVGLFSTGAAEFTTYEVQENNCYRIDFVRNNATFNADPENVVYSQFKKKSVFTFGSSAIYDLYMRTMETLNSAHYKVTRNTTWNNGQYFVYEDGVNEKLGFRKSSTTKNGVLTEVTLQGNGCTITWSVAAEVYGLALEPMNFYEYEKLALSKDNVKEVTTALYYSIDQLKRRYDLRYIEAMDYVVATTTFIADARLDAFIRDPYPFRSYDTETTGLDVCLYGEDRIVGIVLGHNETTATYFPFRHEGDFNLPEAYIEKILKIVLNMQDRCTGHNIKFDEEVTRHEGVVLRLKWDTHQLSIINDPTIAKGIHGLKTLSSNITGRHVLELDEIFVNAKDINFAKLPPEIIKYYACPDGTNSLIVLRDQLERLPKHLFPLAELECALTHIIAEQEFFGIRVDLKRFEHQYHNCNYIIDMLLKAFQTLTHSDGNINSADFVQDLLYNKMKCKVLLRTKTGKPSVAMSAIKKLASIKAQEPKNLKEDLVDLDGEVIIKAKDLNVAAYPALVILRKYREYIKLKTAFYARFERTMKTGRVFFWVNQNGAATGRQSSPMHQLPSALKDCILSDAQDRDFWGPDYSQIELRMIAYLADEPDLKKLCYDPDNDIHRVIGSLISGKEMWEITPEERSIGKRRNFGVVYLISKFGLAGQIYGPGYTTENVEFCGQQLDAFYKRFKRIDRYIKQNAAKVQAKGFMETAWFKRKRMFPEVFDPNLDPGKRASILRMGNNVPVQGTAADYLKLAMVTMDSYIHEKGWDILLNGFPRVRMMLSIHDELIISADRTIPYEEIIEMITKCMQLPVEDAPPFFAQPARMDNWGGHSDDALPIPIPYRDKLIEDYQKTGKSVFKQNYYTVNVPDSLNVDIASMKFTESELMEKYLPQTELVFNYGDYETDITEEHVKDALKKYIVSGFTEYRIDNYKTLLAQYRQTQLKDYMADLISKYGTDYKAVGEHVRHPSLTFMLLENYNDKIPYDMEHVDRITEAARLYIEDILSKPDMQVVIVPNVEVKEKKVSDKDIFNDQLEALVTFDPDGEVVYEDTSEEYEDIYNYFADESPDDVIETVNKPVYVWELADVVTFDADLLTNNKVDLILSYIYDRSDPNGFYRVYLNYKGQVIDTKMHMENIDIAEAEAFMQSLYEGESVWGSKSTLLSPLHT